MKHRHHISMAMLLLCGLLVQACESRKDPFSASNQAPRILRFFFKPDPDLQNVASDSLKYRAGKSYPLHLNYEDAEFSSRKDQTLEARFQFINGGGAISHDKIELIDSAAYVFRVPATFNGDLLFTPDTSGRVRLGVRITDGVKDSADSTASAFFFENLAPNPFFTFRPLTLVNPYRMEFDPAGSQDRDGRIETFVWDFGDGTTPDTLTSNSSVTHEYTLAGQYRVRLLATDDEGRTAVYEQLVTTNNQAPAAELRVIPQSGQAPLEVSYNAGGSFDPDGSIASYLISFDDGETAQDSSGKHTFARDGEYQVLLTVKDNLGLADTTVRAVSVSTPPIAALTVTPDRGAFPLQVEIDASASRDPFGGDVAFKIFIDGDLRYQSEKVTHVFDVPKTSAYLVRLEVLSQRTGLTSTANEEVFVTNTPPVADFTFTPPNPQPTVEINFTSTSFDPDSTDAITNYRWIWGDGTESEGANLRSTIHKYNVSRTYFVKLIVTDRFNGTGEKEVQIEVK